MTACPAFAATSAATLDVFTQVLAELHGFNNVLDDDWFEQALAVLAKLNEKFAVVHVHANNYRPLLAIGNVLFPEVLEVTYASRAKYSFTDCDEVFPGRSTAPIGRLRRTTAWANSSTKRAVGAECRYRPGRRAPLVPD